jgi:hypothetical protein
MNENYENARMTTPEDLARQLFNEQPGEPCSKQILPYTKTYDEDDKLTFIFEILITIYLEGFMNIMEILKETNKEEFKNIKDNEKDYQIYKNITLDDLNFPQPWFNSFGFKIIITEYDRNNRKEYKRNVKPFSYCRILLSFDPQDRIQFILKNIQNKYHFILNASYKTSKNLEDIFATLSKGDKFYKISFKNIMNKEELLS